MKMTRTDTIMVLFRKAFNAPNMKAGLEYMGQAHDAVEQLEKDYIHAQNARAETPTKTERTPDTRTGENRQ